MLRGWISLDRKIQEHWTWKETPFSKGHAWVDLLLSVNHEDKKIPFDSQIILVKRGSMVTSLKKLSERWGWSIKKTSGFLNVLEQDKMVEQKRNARCTTLTVVNYDNFQGMGITKETVKKRSGNAEETLRKTNNNDNNVNNENKKDKAPSADSENGIDYSNMERKWD